VVLESVAVARAGTRGILPPIRGALRGPFRYRWLRLSYLV